MSVHRFLHQEENILEELDMKKLFLAAITVLAFNAVFAQSSLKFRPDGSFKIVQFTDLHYNSCKKESTVVLKRIQEVLDAERPDLVVITGDLIYSSPARKALRQIFNCISSQGIPFCSVWGNHDADFGTDKGTMYDFIRSFPCCVMPDRSGVLSPDYTLPILSSDGEKAASVLYLMDSNAHIFQDGKFVGYDWIKESQVEWYKSTSRQFTADNGGQALPSVAFFHIPLPEFHDAVRNEYCTMIGTRMEPACAPEHNSGMFAACKEMGDVMAIFAGHDHDNDYAVEFQDILLAYGRYTGGNTEYNNLPNGARVIILKEGKRELDSYVRIKGGQILNRFSFPGSFHQADWRSRPLDPECR